MSALPDSAPLRPPVALLCALALGCGPTIRHTLSTNDQRHITYEDLCHLQSWFDQRAASNAAPFGVVDEQSTETTEREPDEHGHLRHVELGEGTYLIATREDRVRFHQLLRDEYSRLPSLAISAPEASVRVHVSFWKTGAVRRIRPDVEVTVEVGGSRVELPSHPCVGEFLFGAQSYAMRHNVMEAERARARGEIPAAYVGDAAAEVATDAAASAVITATDAGVTDAGVTDAGAADARVAGDAR